MEKSQRSDYPTNNKLSYRSTRRKCYPKNYHYSQEIYHVRTPYSTPRYHTSHKFTFGSKYSYRKPKEPPKQIQKPLSRPISPELGSDEHMARKVAQTSALIMRHLLSPDDETNLDENPHKTPKESVKNGAETLENTLEPQKNDSGKTKSTCKDNFNVEDVHDKIINHVSNLNDGRRKNLINVGKSGYDDAIRNINKQRRLELSRALRCMCLQGTQDSSDIISSIIPDIGIKIEDLPPDVIEQLRQTLNLDLEGVEISENHEEITIKEEGDVEGNSLESPSLIPRHDSALIKIKEEPPDEFNTIITPDDNSKNLINDPENSINSEIIDAQSTNSDLFEKKFIEISTQTDCESKTLSLQRFVTSFVRNMSKDEPKNISDTVDRMLCIDKCISRLTKYRQSLFRKYATTNTNEKNSKDVKRKTSTDVSCKKRSKSGSSQCTEEEKRKSFVLDSIDEKILYIKVIETTLIASSENGKLLFFNTHNGHLTTTIQITENLPVTTFLKNEKHLYVGSHEPTLKIYDFYKRVLLETIKIDNGDSIQCMETQWGYIFLGCTKGTLLRYSIKNSRFEFQEKLTNSSVLVLRATLEGARRILIVGSRNCSVSIRDAMSGLYMRDLDALFSPTVYCLLLEKNLVYCGTTNHDVLVFSFHEGRFLYKFNADVAKSIGCMKIVGNLLFASCHNGNVYVFDINTRDCVGIIEGPGGVILSMEVLDDQIVVGTMSRHFKAIPICDKILCPKSPRTL